MSRDPLRHHRAHHVTGMAERIAERVAEGMGTVQFVICAFLFVAFWITVNGGYAFFTGAINRIEHGKPFDTAPWILLNLIFSFEAFFTGALVVIAQKAQSKRDGARELADAQHREELAAEQRELLNENTALTREVRELTMQVHKLVAKGHDASGG